VCIITLFFYINAEIFTIKLNGKDDMSFSWCDLTRENCELSLANVIVQDAIN
jgi:hypothetical protein